MYAGTKLLLLLVAGLLLQHGSCVIWGPKARGGHRGRVEPRVFELETGSKQEFSDIANKLKDPVSERSRFRRDVSANDSIGYTTPLVNDPHYQAVVHWTGYPSEYLFIVTRRRTSEVNPFHSRYSSQSFLWRSTDYGHTFVNETYKFDDNAVIEWYYISPFSEYIIFADRLHRKVYVTRDEGNTYNSYTTPFVPDDIIFQSRYAVNSSDLPQNQYVLGYDVSNQSLWVSTNLGAQWTRLDDNVVIDRYYWRHESLDVERSLTSVFYEKAVNSVNSMLYSTDSPGTVAPALFDPQIGMFIRNTFVLAHEYMFVQKNGSSVQQQYRSPLWVSRNRKPFKQAMFPVQFPERHYAVVDASEGQVFIAVYHDINTTNLYLSEEEGIDYSISLELIISPPESQWTNGYPAFDVHVVEGIVGTYFANQKVFNSRYGATVISYDKGGKWRQLVPPAVDRTGTPIVSCSPPECSLHFHMDSDVVNGYSSILSQDSAVGLIMAQGNLGSTLSTNSSQLRLYFSRDGGISWTEVDSGSWVFQFAALGSIVVAVQKRQVTTSVRWTCDEGRTWPQNSFSNSSGVHVVGMLTEIGEKARHVTIFGYYNIFSFEWLIIDLNFTSVVPNQCPLEDYFLWVPTDERPGSRCLLGEVITYERRDASHCCYINPLYDRPVSRIPCTCSGEDFECDFGFERLTLNSPCTPLPYLTWPPPPPDDCEEGNNYTFTSGYRKVAGDRCIPGNETYFFDITRPCPVRAPRGLFIEHQLYVVPDDVVTFTLTQVLGSRLSTTYRWDFNDSSDPVTVTGYDNGHSQTHNFTRPGVFNVTLFANNSGGSAEILVTVTVLDPISNIDIVYPIQYSQVNHSVPTGIYLVFTSSIVTQYNTNYTGDVLYSWNFGDGTEVVTTSKTTVTHNYNASGTFQLVLTVRTQIISSGADVSAYINVFDYAKTVHITSNDLHMVSSQQYAIVGEYVMFTLIHEQPVPPNTMYTWHVLLSGDSHDISAHETFRTRFESAGNYLITVVGLFDTGSFAAQTNVIAEEQISKLSITLVPVIRSGGLLKPNISVMNSASNTYQGYLALKVLNSNKQVFSTNLNHTEQNLQVQFTLGSGVTESGVANVMFNASNHVVFMVANKEVTIVAMGDYGAVNLIFDVTSLSQDQYNSPKWKNSLANSIQNRIATTYHISIDFIEIESVEVRANNTQTATVAPQHSVLKRATSPMFLFVSVNILPQSLSETHITSAKAITSDLINSGNNGSLSVTVNGNSLTVSRSEERNVIHDDGTTNWKLYSSIGGGLGAVLVLVVLVAVVMGVVIFFYYKKYNRLSVRYSRLRQTPVRFTFTQEGEMVEDEDPEDDHFTDDDEKPDDGSFPMQTSPS